MESTTWIRFCELRTSAVVGVIVVCLLNMLKPVTTASSELNTNSVNVSLYLTTLEQWNGGVKSTFEKSVKDQATTYCSANLASCGLTRLSSSFSEVAYKRAAAYVKPELSFQYGLKLPADSDKISGGNTDYLNLAALQIISLNARSSLSGSDVDVIKVGSTNYGPVPDAVINGVVSAVVAVLVIALALTVCLLNAKCSEGYEKWVEPVANAEQPKDVEKADEKKKQGKVEDAQKEDLYQPETRVMTPVTRITPQPVTAKSMTEMQEGKALEENQNNGATPVVTVMNQEGSGATPVAT